MSADQDFEAVIGLEVHAQLATETKIFCGCRARPPAGKTVAEVPINAHSCPVCSGHPGTLPVLNRQAVEFAIRAGLATGCRINPHNVFARKNYFYPDLPKGYQTSQYDQPICLDGFLEITTPQGGVRKISIQRIHMEEDAGKNTHGNDHSVVNLNRAGVPLCEIVSAPELKSAEEAGTYLRALHAIVTSIGICDGNMQEGNFRCDANVSVMPKGSSTLGTRVEIKNVNSFRFVEKAIDYEISRQIEVIRAGGRIVQETRSYDADRDLAVSMRTKEEAHDYRYFPEPDLIPVLIDAAWIARVSSSLPELPGHKRARYVSELGLSEYDAGVLTASHTNADFFEKSLQLAPGLAKVLSNLLTGEVARLLKESSLELGQALLTPQHLAEVGQMLNAGLISSTGAKQVLGFVWKTGEPVSLIVEREGLKQVSDLSALDPVIDRILAANPGQVAQYKSGKDKLIGFFVGQVMKETGGKANPALLQELIKKRLT